MEEKNIKTCPECGNKYEVKKGDIWKKLFRKPTTNEWITLALLIMVILAGFAYTRDTALCRDTLNNIDQICVDRYKNMLNKSESIRNYSESPLFNISNIKLPET